MACTGQRGPSTFPTTMSTPSLKGSVLDCFRWTFSMRGESSLSTATSSKVRWLVSLNELSSGTVISPDLRKPKKHSVEAAHSMRPSQFLCLTSQVCLILDSSPGVIGCQRLGFLFTRWALLTPLITSSSFGIKLMFGSPSSLSMCRCRSASR